MAGVRSRNGRSTRPRTTEVLAEYPQLTREDVQAWLAYAARAARRPGRGPPGRRAAGCRRHRPRRRTRSPAARRRRRCLGAARSEGSLSDGVDLIAGWHAEAVQRQRVCGRIGHRQLRELREPLVAEQHDAGLLADQHAGGGLAGGPRLASEYQLEHGGVPGVADRHGLIQVGNFDTRTVGAAIAALAPRRSSAASSGRRRHENGSE